jgi:uncharacterized RDD family membrane protein YckC
MTDPSSTFVTPEAVEVALGVAGLGSRMAAVAIDSAIQLVLFLVLFLVSGAGLSAINAPDSVAIVLLAAGSFLILWGYFAFFEALMGGKTPGKKALKLKVVQADGQPARLRAVVVRNLVRIVDMLPTMYAVGVITILASKRSQRLGDLAAGTIVVHDRTSKLRAETPFVVAGGATIDAAGIGEREYGIVRSFLQRRETLEAGVRAALALKIASAMRPSTGPGPIEDEAYLEALARSYRARFTREP